MAVLSLDQAARLTELGKVTITRAIKSCWHSARRKADGNYEIDPVEPEPSARRSHALIPWRAARLADLRADDELRHRLALAEEKLTDFKAALEDMRAQRDAWQAMAQARIRPAPSSSTSRWPWLRATGWCRNVLARLGKQRANIIQAIKHGVPAIGSKDDLARIVLRREELESLLAGTKGESVLLHPNMGAEYRKQVANLAQVSGRYSALARWPHRIEAEPAGKAGNRSQSSSASRFTEGARCRDNDPLSW
jgi:hypothetical protein